MTTTEDEPVSEYEPARHRRYERVLSAVLGTAVAALLAFVVVRLVVSGVFGVDGNRYTAAALALTPYAVPFGVLLAVLAWVARRRHLGAASLALAVTLALPMVPRVLPDTGPAVDGPTMRVLASNVYFGQADADRLVGLVAEHHVDVLVLTELERHTVRALDDAGLAELLPYRLFRPAAGGVGSGIAARYPLESLDLVGRSTFAQPSARLRVAGQAVEIVAVHPLPPVTDARTWRAELNGLPGASREGPVRVLAGDFNATLDHARFRAVLDRGYVDAAERRGRALVPTWPRERFGPPVTLDHVLVDERAAVRDFETFDVDGADHRAVLATVRLPTPQPRS
ncbi:endonuclease/exonuclease/phosphatase family protein [Saccharomonospora saliphila]|uniref:endonuclease/exonuclease/phosphatase family protein n=1 Tax=Saccharomonospora saliphila TaxID=369829 RepID=UPI00036BAD56|nr:endonuclease/exonuclease/phosphatase family protein [Saccharomonospora saliphila]